MSCLYCHFILYSDVYCVLRNCETAKLLLVKYHSDIKPENCFWDDKLKCLRLADFGLTRRLNGHKLTPGMVTRWYRAPEILLGETYDEKVDIFAAGATLTECITGRVLFHSASDIDQMHYIDAFEGSGQILDDISGSFTEDDMVLLEMAAALLARMLARNPSERPSAGEALCDDFFRRARDMHLLRLDAPDC